MSSINILFSGRVDSNGAFVIHGAFSLDNPN